MRESNPPNLKQSFDYRDSWPRSAVTHGRIWHAWLPCRVCTFMWLLHNEGLPLGSCLTKMAIDGSYKLCTQAPIETARHAFIDCPQVTRAWKQFTNLRRLHNLPLLQFTLANILEGALLTRRDLNRSIFSYNC